MNEDTKFEMLGITKKELDQMYNYVSDYESLEKSLDRHYFSIEDEEFKETIMEMQQLLAEYEAKKYEDYKAKIEEFENFSWDDYVDNDAIADEYRRDIMRGLKNGI